MCDLPYPHAHPTSGSAPSATETMCVVLGIGAVGLLSAAAAVVFQSDFLVYALGLTLLISFALCFHIPRIVIAAALGLLGLAVAKTYRWARDRRRQRRATVIAPAATGAQRAIWSVRVNLIGQPPAMTRVEGGYRTSAELETETWLRLKERAEQTGQPLPAIQSIVARRVLAP